MVGPKCDGLYVPLVPLQREITWDAEYQPDIHGHAFANVQESRSRSLWSSGRLYPAPLINMSSQQGPIKEKSSRHAS